MFFRHTLALGVVAAGLMHSSGAWAQSCCAGGSALTPGRLTVHEDVLVGLQLRAQSAVGEFSADGSFRGTPRGAIESGFEESALASLRVFRPMQVSLVVPFVETYRRTSTTSEFGGGLGDLNLSARYDLVLAGKYTYVPGVAMLGGASLPSGTSVAGAEKPLATDATGIGAVQVHAGVAIEQVWGHWMLNLAAILSIRAPETVSGIHSQLGPQLSSFLGVGYTFDNEAALAASLGYTFEMRAEVNGETIPGTARRAPQFGISGLFPLGDHMRLSGGPTVHVPFLPGANQTTFVAFSLTWVRTWT